MAKPAPGEQSHRTAEAISSHIRATNPSTVQVVSHIDPAESEKLRGLAERAVRSVKEMVRSLL